MRTFSCFITAEGSTTPTLSVILADTEERARELARRELMDARRPLAIELCEGGECLWFEKVEPGEPARLDAARERRSIRSWRRARQSPTVSAA